jgi:2-haloacid dehalogenase
VLFVAGSGFDLIGTASVGMKTLWHNRAGLKKPDQAPPPFAESKDLKGLIPFLKS